jgi:hypothetical protein
MQHQALATENLRKESSQWFGHLAELTEYERFLLSRSNFFANGTKSLILPAFCRFIMPVAHELAWMIADLLEPEQVREDKSSALHAIHPVECTGKILD